MQWLIDKIQVNIPFTMLYESYLELLIQHRVNPEIGLDAATLDRFSFSQFKEIAEKLHAHGLTITLHGPFMDLSPGSADPAILEMTCHRFKQVLPLIPLFKAKKLICHAGYDWKRYGYNKEDWVTTSLETWSWFAKSVSDSGSKLMLENVYEHHPDEISVLFESLNRKFVGFCLDTGHQAAFSRASLQTWLDSLSPYLGHLHLHDNDGQKDDHVALGNGTIDFKWLFNYLKETRETPPTITLEPHREEDLWPSIEYLARIWPW
ncbi:sugar phosphate isomerase/epimerase family protein [Thermodesulfobacteriota bacterium]